MSYIDEELIPEPEVYFPPANLMEPELCVLCKRFIYEYDEKMFLQTGDPAHKDCVKQNHKNKLLIH